MVRWSWIVALGLAAALGACRTEDPVARRQVILVVLDAARADRFGFAGYVRETTPAIDQLAAEGAVFQSHHAHATHTRASIPNLIYSRYFVKSLFPTSSHVPFDSPAALMRRLDDEVISLPRALAMEGFATAAISAHSWLKPGTVFADQFDELQDLAGELRRYSPPAEIAVGRALDWIERHRDGDYFLYLHLMDTHFPHSFGPDARRFHGSGEIPFGDGSVRERDVDLDRPASEAEKRYLDALYDGSLRYADRQVGRIVEHLKAEGLLDDTLIAITSDHGEHLLEVPDRFGHGGPWFERVARIPLVIAYPDRVAPQQIEVSTGLVDVAPTLLSLLGVELPGGKSMDGRSLLGESPLDERAVLSSMGIRTRRYKVLIHDGRTILSREEPPELDQVSGQLFDLMADPDELHDLWGERPEVSRELVRHYWRELRDPHRRFVEAINHNPPTGAFAISAGHFETDGLLLDVAAGADPKAWEKVSQPGQWLRSRSWKQSWIVARESAEPLAIHFSLPNGRYKVAAHVRGRGAIALGPQAALRSVDPAQDPSDGSRTRVVEVGEVEVDGEVFRAILHPPPDGSWLWVKMLGLEPVGPGVEQAMSLGAGEHEAQLRALGYVE